MELDGVIHRTIRANGINIHYAEAGSGPLVLFLHGFPECWYSWRKQITAFSEAGYHAVAPDLRGYGDTDAPDGVEKYSYFHIVGDLIGLLDALQVQRAFLVAHDWGAIIGWNLCLFRPERIIAFTSLSNHFMPRNPHGSGVKDLRSAFGDHHYVCQFQEPGKAEAVIEKISAERFLLKVYSDKLSQDFMFYESDDDGVLRDGISREDISYYVNAFKKNGFTPAINYYRALDLSWELSAAWTGSKVTVPSLFIIGEDDIVYNFPGVKQYINGGGVSTVVPNLKEIIIVKDTGHFIQAEKPTLVNDHILRFFKTFDTSEILMGSL